MGTVETVEKGWSGDSMRNKQVQVFVGKLDNPEEVMAENPVDRTVRTEIPVSSWDKRAMWSWLRLNYTRNIDSEISSVIWDAELAVRRQNNIDPEAKWRTIPSKVRAEINIEREKALKGFFDIRVLSTDLGRQRDLQYIMDGNHMAAVASLEHLLIPPEEVYQVAKQVFAASGIKLKPAEHGLHGMVGYIKEVQGLNFGLQMFGGNILTRKAIKVGCFVRVELCTNPISWLGVGGFMGWVKAPDSYERVLRVQSRTDLDARIAGAVSGAQRQLKDLEGKLEHTKKVSLSSKGAKIITGAMGWSYGLGAKMIQQVLDAYKSEDQTQWGLSMALSWVAAHGEFRKAGRGKDHRHQSLSTISGALLLIDDMKAAEKKSLGWIKSHIEQGRLKSMDELLKDVL